MKTNDQTFDFDKAARMVVKIDELNLDKECIRLPGDYLRFANEAADAKRTVDELKLELETLEAETANIIRLAPDRYNIEKITETAINNAVASSSKVRKAQHALIEAKHKAELRQNAVWALEHKKRALTMLVELHGQSYFSTPRVTQEGKEAVERMMQRKVRKMERDND